MNPKTPKNRVHSADKSAGSDSGKWDDEPQLNHYFARFAHRSAPVRTLRGVVRDHLTKRSVAGAEISRTGDPVTTKEDGRFEMTALPKQDVYQILVNTSSGRYLNMSMRLKDTPGISPLEFNIDLPRGITARGRVTERETGNPIAGIVEYNPLFPNAYLDRFGFNNDPTLDAHPSFFVLDRGGRIV